MPVYHDFFWYPDPDQRFLIRIRPVPKHCPKPSKFGEGKNQKKGKGKGKEKGKGKGERGRGKGKGEGEEEGLPS